MNSTEFPQGLKRIHPEIVTYKRPFTICNPKYNFSFINNSKIQSWKYSVEKILIATTESINYLNSSKGLTLIATCWWWTSAETVKYITHIGRSKFYTVLDYVDIVNFKYDTSSIKNNWFDTPTFFNFPYNERLNTIGYNKTGCFKIIFNYSKLVLLCRFLWLLIVLRLGIFGVIYEENGMDVNFGGNNELISGIRSE